MVGNTDLIENYRQMHSAYEYGNTSVKNLRFIRPEIKILRPKSIADYGCGQSKLLDLLNLDYPTDLFRYDPAIPEFARRPERVFDLLINIDVLEHIEERDLDDILFDMRQMCRNAIIIVDTKEAVTKLADGRNAHVTVRPGTWWRDKIGRHFGYLETIPTVRRTRAGFKTWKRSWGDAPSYFAMRSAENANYFARRVLGKPRYI